MLDDKRVDATFDPSRNLLIYVTKATGKIVDQPLTDGRHTVMITAADYRGNKSEQAWSFIVNNTLPAATRQAPVARTPRATTTTPRTNGRGTRRNATDNGGGTGDTGTPPTPPNR